MVMFQVEVVEEVNEDLIVVDERTGDEWVWKGLVAHCEIINSQKLVDINFV